MKIFVCMLRAQRIISEECRGEGWDKMSSRAFEAESSVKAAADDDEDEDDEEDEEEAEEAEGGSEDETQLPI